MITYDYIQITKDISEKLGAMNTDFRRLMSEMEIMLCEYNNMKCELAKLKQLDPAGMMAKIKKQIDEEFKNKYGA